MKIAISWIYFSSNYNTVRLPFDDLHRLYIKKMLKRSCHLIHREGLTVLYSKQKFQYFPLHIRISNLKLRKICSFLVTFMSKMSKNSTRQVYYGPRVVKFISEKKKLFGQQKQIRKMHKLCIIND